jgi:DNA-binding transcriptional LysR family regulator
MRGKVDVAFLRRDTQTTGLAFKFLIKEPLIAVLPTGHRLAARKAIRPHYAAKVGITLKPKHTMPITYPVQCRWWHRSAV